MYQAWQTISVSVACLPPELRGRPPVLGPRLPSPCRGLALMPLASNVEAPLHPGLP